MRVLTIDVGGTNVKVLSTGQTIPRGKQRKKAPSRRPARAPRVDVSPGFEAASAT